MLLARVAWAELGLLLCTLSRAFFESLFYRVPRSLKEKVSFLNREIDFFLATAPCAPP